MRQVFIICVFVIAFAGISCAQITFHTKYSYGSYRFISAITKTADGGYITCGTKHSTTLPFYDAIYLLKLDGAGQVLWNKDYVDTIYHYPPSSIQLCSDGGFILCGHAVPSGANFDLYLTRTDSLGTILWSKIIGNNPTYEIGFYAQQTNDGGFIACGYFGDSIVYCYILKTDAAGNLEWTKTIKESSSIHGNWAHHVEQTLDNGYIVAGKAYETNTSGDVNSLLIKIDSIGNTEWVKKYGVPSYDYFRNVYQTNDGGFIIGGEIDTVNDSIVKPLFLLVKTDSSGAIIWSKAYGGNSNSQYVLSKMIQTSDSGFVFAGFTNIVFPDNLYLFKTDTSGNLLWSKAYGGIDSYDAIDVVQANDEGYFLCGKYTNGPVTLLRSHLIKTDSYGNSNCSDAIPITLSSNIILPLLSTSYIEGTNDTSYSEQLIETIISVTIDTVCFSTGMQEYFSEGNDEIFLFPNPATDYITIHYNISSQKETTVSVFNIYGQVVKPLTPKGGLQNAGKQEMKIDIKDLPQGIYFVKVSADGKEEVRKVVKY